MNTPKSVASSKMIGRGHREFLSMHDRFDQRGPSCLKAFCNIECPCIEKKQLKLYLFNYT